MTIIVMIILTILAVISLFIQVVSEKRKLNTYLIERPLTEDECDYMLTLPALGATIPAHQEISPAHEQLLLINLVTEEWSPDGKTRTIAFTDEGQNLARLMRSN